jgi:hypothetical protein
MIVDKVLNKAAVASVLWTLAVAAIGWAAGFESLMAWLFVGLLGVGPSAVLMHFWKDIPRTTSEAIQEARR